MPESIEGIAGVLIWTTRERFPAMRDFYVDTLGLRPRSDRDYLVNFDWGDQRLTVSIHHDLASDTARDPLRVMVNLAVSDIQSTSRALESRGVVFTRPPEQESWGGWIATFNDPDGNTLQLLQPSG